MWHATTTRWIAVGVERRRRVVVHRKRSRVVGLRREQRCEVGVDLADLGMVTGDPRRTPTFIMFANPNYYLDATNTFGCPPGAAQPGCVYQYQGDAYNHGDVAPDINRTWLGMVGPGVKTAGETGAVWSDHTDDRPTMLKVLGLRDDYSGQGRVLSEILQPQVARAGLRAKSTMRMARVYKQLESPVGELGLQTLAASTGALTAGDPGERIFKQCSSQLDKLASRRDAVAEQMLSLLNGAAFGHRAIDPAQARLLTAAGEEILKQALTTREYCT